MQPLPPRLSTHGQELLTASLAWMDPRWDDSVSMLKLRSYHGDAEHEYIHHVRETCWYALGLLIRGDADKAARAIDAVLKCQFDAPDAPFHGTWLRHPEEPMPGADAREWRDYDPNWREFIGTTLVMILSHFENVLPQKLVDRIDAAIRLACVGTIRRNVHAEYTNIALMSAFLLDFAGTRFGEPGWVASAEKLGAEIYSLFTVHGTFPEYNSPTYYGVDLVALALWRSYAPNTKLRAWGNEMEHTLWRDISQYYHAGMRNIAGPFDRSYGMDMRRYAAGAGMWIWLGIGRELAPFPDTTKSFDHAHDFAFAPLFAACGSNIPEDVVPHLTSFTGPHQVTRQITEKRTATAWLDERLMLGGEWTNGDTRAWDQFHPATVHWQSGEDIFWMRIETFGGINVRVEKNKMSISVPARDGDATGAAFRWLIYTPGTEASTLNSTAWSLHGLRVGIESENIAISKPTDSDGQLVIDCTLTAGKSGSMSMVFEIA